MFAKYLKNLKNWAMIAVQKEKILNHLLTPRVDFNWHLSNLSKAQKKFISWSSRFQIPSHRWLTSASHLRSFLSTLRKILNADSSPTSSGRNRSFTTTRSTNCPSMSTLRQTVILLTDVSPSDKRQKSITKRPTLRETIRPARWKLLCRVTTFVTRVITQLIVLCFLLSLGLSES